MEGGDREGGGGGRVAWGGARGGEYGRIVSLEKVRSMTQLSARSRSPLLMEGIVGASPSATYVIVRKKLEEEKTLTPFERHLATAWGWLEDTAVQSVQEGLVKPIQLLSKGGTK